MNEMTDAQYHELLTILNTRDVVLINSKTLQAYVKTVVDLIEALNDRDVFDDDDDPELTEIASMTEVASEKMARAAWELNCDH
jgi:ribosome assembly protein YihI (activator of Der GTPase)